MNLLKNLCPAIFDSFEGNFLHMHFVEEQRSYTRCYGSINVFRYAIGSRGVGRIRDGYVDLRRCFGLE